MKPHPGSRIASYVPSIKLQQLYPISPQITLKHPNIVGLLFLSGKLHTHTLNET